MGARSSRRAPPRDEGTAFRRPSPSCQAHRDPASAPRPREPRSGGSRGRRAQEARTRSDPPREGRAGVRAKREARASEAGSQASEEEEGEGDGKGVSQALPSERQQAKGRTAIPSEDVKRGRGRATAALQPLAESVAPGLSRLRANLTKGVGATSERSPAPEEYLSFVRGSENEGACLRRSRQASVSRSGVIPANFADRQRPPPKTWSWGASAWQRAQRGSGPRSSM